MKVTKIIHHDYKKVVEVKYSDGKTFLTKKFKYTEPGFVYETGYK